MTGRAWVRWSQGTRPFQRTRNGAAITGPIREKAAGVAWAGAPGGDQGQPAL
jgi:hypothetical protein